MLGSKKNIDDDQKAKLYLKAISLYKGKFLPNFAYDEWAVNPTTYYHRLFVESVASLYRIFEKKGQYEQMIPICEKAIPIDVYDEDIYIIYIQCLVKLDKRKEAFTAYQTITRRLYDQLGVNPSKELYKVHKDIIKTLKSVEMDLQTIKNDLKEEGQSESCFFCEYLVFKAIYRQIARSVSRTGQSIYVMLCTLADNQDKHPNIHRLPEAMEQLKSNIGTVLRQGDLFARYSHSQFVIMLMDTNYENGEAVGKRVEAAYNQNKISKVVLMSYKIQPLDPKDSIKRT